MTTARIVAICVLSAAFVGSVVLWQRLRINLTPSMPIGVWQASNAPEPLVRGHVVEVCLTGPAERLGRARGYIGPGLCPDGGEPLMKPIGAVPGDTVVVMPGGVMVNNILVPHTAALPRDDAGRPLAAVPVGQYQVVAREVWLLSGYDPRSYDSRYFGAVPTTAIIASLRPLLISREVTQ